jgi:hypothetical protein
MVIGWPVTALVMGACWADATPGALAEIDVFAAWTAGDASDAEAGEECSAEAIAVATTARTAMRRGRRAVIKCGPPGRSHQPGGG